MNMKLVTLNGPLGVGKSWAADRVAQLLPDLMIFRVSFQDPLRKAAMALLGVSESQVPYSVFKDTIYFGLTGREWMIQMSEDFAKQREPLFFSKVMHLTMRNQLQPVKRKAIFMADSNGFESELDYFRVQPDIDLLACSIEPPDSAPRGTPWIPGDSRFNLAHKCTLVREDSTQMAHAIVDALERRGWV